MDFINEKYTRDYFSSSLFSPFSYLLIDLFSNFGLNFSNISSKKSKETLGSTVDNINFMESDSMNNFLSFL
jgi:hypothetical protein